MNGSAAQLYAQEIPEPLFSAAPGRALDQVEFRDLHGQREERQRKAIPFAEVLAARARRHVPHLFEGERSAVGDFEEWAVLSAELPARARDEGQGLELDLGRGRRQGHVRDL